MNEGICVAIILLLACLQLVYASPATVFVEFFYFPSGCTSCDKAKPLILQTEKEYDGKIDVEWIDVSRSEGLQRFRQYNLTRVPAVVVNHEYTILSNEISLEKLRTVIEAYLQETPLPPSSSTPLNLIVAFSLGFFETFSPCLIAILSFILSYTIGKATRFKEGMLYVIIFGIGFVSAAIFIGVTFALVLISMPSLQNAFVWIICAFVIIFGFNLLGLFKLPFQTKSLVKKLTERYAFTYAGLFSLGFLFYFLDPCISPFLFSVLVMLQNSEFTLPLILFCLGAILPFIFIGIAAGSASKLTRKTYKHRRKIRVISGLILISYALYLILSYLL
ncbi:MAG: cytochrome c biogenesis protein CcdA [Candidatus Bathyarchaeota archaeon]|nr:cytochrome c biogenesis protein [Candidatus Bathyarchaeota archaeon A05DMB-5]MDH7557505.1 cytochrome c biogenesis protein CcdA [Candidatus Bathyarchaeota archaeon]